PRGRVRPPGRGSTASRAGCLRVARGRRARPALGRTRPAAGQTLPRAGPGRPERRGRRPRLLPGNGRRAGGASRSGGTLGGRGGLRARDIAWIGRLGKAVLSIFCLRLPTRMVMRIGRPGGTGRPRLGAPRRGTTVYVACSSLCFGRYPLAQALHTIS